MVTLEDAVIARLTTHGTTFEVLVDPDLTLAFRTGDEGVEISDVLAAETVFKDSKKGDKASEEMMKEIFGSTDALKVAEEIIHKGDIQVTTEQRRKMQDDRRKQIVAIVSRRAVDPHSGLPHPPQRIDGALSETKVHIDALKSAEQQLPEVLEALRVILPLKFETRRIAVKIPATHAGRAIGTVKSFGGVEKEEWLKDGSWVVVVKIPAGIQPEFFEKLNDLTKGEVETKVL